MHIFRTVAIALAALALIAYGGWSWLTAREAPPEISRYEIDLDAIRSLAASLPGPRPTHVNAERVAVAQMPRAAIFAGESFDSQSMSHVVYQIVGPDGFVLLDTGFGPDVLPDADYDAAAFSRVLGAMIRAERIVVTHEHADHIAGLSQVEDPAALEGRLLLNRAQQTNTERLDLAGVPQALRDLPALDYDGLHALVPGVVLLEAPGHTPGTQMVYVVLADGTELLFLGDVAWHSDQIRNLHYRPRLVTDWFLDEDREAVLHQFRALHDLAQRERDLQLVVSHDLGQLAALQQSGVLGRSIE